MQNLLRNIHEGMKVVDARNKEIGKVDWVQFGGDNPSTAEPEAASVSDVERQRDEGLIADIAEAFRVDDLPEEVRSRLMLQGFVRIDADGILAADRYVLPEQISAVSGDSVQLNVEKSELMKRH